MLKNNKKYALAKPKSQTFTSICLMLNYFNVKNVYMFKSLKNLKEIDHIVSCVLYKTPVTYNLEIDKTILKNFGINLNLPVFFVKNYDKKYLKLLVLSTKYIDFNLIFNEDTFKYFKILKNIKYYVLNTNFASIKLLNNIMALNINAKDKFKVKKMENVNKFEIKNNNEVIFPSSKIENNFLCDDYNNNNVNIEVKKFVNDGEYLCFKILNKSNVTQKVELNYNYKLEGKYYEFNKITNGLCVREILQNEKNFFCDNLNLKYFYPNNFCNELTLPFLKISKKFTLTQYCEKKFILYIGNKQLSKNNLLESIELYNKKIREIINLKIKCGNKKLEYLVNFYLPNRIILEDVNRIEKFNIENFEECCFLYKQKKMSSLNFYLWLKTYYLGIIENENFVKFSPLLKENFTVYYHYNQKTKEILFNYDAKSKKYMVINDVKFYNYNVISKQNLDKIDKLMLVV